MAESPPEEARPLNLVQKLAKVRQKFGYVQQRGKNDFHKYSYAKVADMIGPIGDLLAELNVTVQRRRLEVKREIRSGDSKTVVYATVHCDFVFVDGDAPWVPGGRANEVAPASGYSEFAVESYGEGMDTGDKAVYKAFTGAEKYCYRQTFQLATGDEDDAERQSLSFEETDAPDDGAVRLRTTRVKPDAAPREHVEPITVEGNSRAEGGGLDPAQVAELQTLITETNTQLVPLCKSFQATRLEGIKPEKFDQVKNMLLSRKKIQQREPL